MKKSPNSAVKICSALLLPCFLFLAAPARAEDCPKNTEACAAGGKKMLPFLQAAAAAESKAAPVPAAKTKSATGLKPAAKAPEKTAVTAEVAPSTAPAQPPAAENYSSPAWLLFVGACMAGLYFYLRENARRGRKK